ncbi:antirestriction protein ArdA [Ornithinimicrobium sp. INDO-MA30-4]|uniref:antirestriction protein ArdA n=1 Tax=Ornithinimicrobium sp. INDO-MA30-4 TaxID=2908651 RepID=UPI001F1C3964|nr:antirestriction protein ArdA [Ornithinimicrobium sp. INDO-MA30-4]UJH70454.1 antirestriction protein ArdA [Ornithinimicrobium sp. INDO-MA30-4]
MNEHDPRTEKATNPEREQAPRLHPKVWIGSWADYNDGRLHGNWCDAAVETETLWADVQAILATSHDLAAEDFGIFDHDGFGGYQPGESDQLEHVATVARGIAEHGPAFAAYAELHDGDLSMLSSFTDAYLGEHESTVAWAEAFMDESGARETIERMAQEQVGDLARYVHIDTESWAQDAWLSGDVAVAHRPEGGVWIFSSNP